MPKIPIYNPNLIIETPRGPKAELEELFAAGRRSAAEVVGTVKGIEENWEKIGQFVEAKKRAEDVTKMLGIEDQMNKDDLEVKTGIALHTDYENVEKDTENILKANEDKYMKMVGNNPRLQQGVSRAMISRFNGLRNDARVKKLGLMADYAKTSFDSIYDEYLRKYANAPDETTRALLTQGIASIGDATVANFGLKQEYVQNKLSKFLEDAQTTMLIKVNNSNDIDIIKNALKLLENPESFSAIDPKSREIMIGHLKSKLEPLEKQEKKGIEEKVINDTIEDLQSKYGDDFNLMLKQLTNPNYQKERNISKLLVDKVYNSMTALKENYQAKRHSADDAIMKEANLLWGRGQLTRAWVEANAKNAYEPERVHQLYELLKSPTEGKDDSSAYFKILQQLQNPYISDVDKKKIEKEILSGPLSISTKKTLGRELYAPVDKSIFNDPWFKRADKEIKESLGWTEQMGFLALGKETGIKAQTSYRDISYKLIQDIKEENLKGEDIYKRSRQLILPKQMEFYNLLMGGGKDKEPEKQKEKYEIGKIYPDAHGRKAKYLGNGKWEKIGW